MDEGDTHEVPRGEVTDTSYKCIDPFKGLSGNSFSDSNSTYFLQRENFSPKKEKDFVLEGEKDVKEMRENQEDKNRLIHLNFQVPIQENLKDFDAEKYSDHVTSETDSSRERINHNESNVQSYFPRKDGHVVPSESKHLVKGESLETQNLGITTADGFQTDSNRDKMSGSRGGNDSEIKNATNEDRRDAPITDKCMEPYHSLQPDMKSQIVRHGVHTSDDSYDYDDDDEGSGSDDRVTKHSKPPKKDENKSFSINDVQIQRSSMVLKLLQDINADDDEEEEDDEDEEEDDLLDSEKSENEPEADRELGEDVSVGLPLASHISNEEDHVHDLKLIDCLSRDLFEGENKEMKLFTLNENVGGERNEGIAEESDIKSRDLVDELRDSITEKSERNEVNLSADNLHESSSKPASTNLFESKILISNTKQALEDPSPISENVFDASKSTADAINVIEAVDIPSRLINISSTETNFDESSISDDLEEEIMEVISDERQVEVLSPSEESGEEYDIEKDIEDYFAERKESLRETSNSIQTTPRDNSETPETVKDENTADNLDDCKNEEQTSETIDYHGNTSGRPIEKELLSLQADDDVESENKTEISSNEEEVNLDESKQESEKQMFGGLKKLFFDFFKVDKKSSEEKHPKEKKSVSVGENNSGSSSESESSGDIKNCSASSQVIDKSIEEKEDGKFFDLNGVSKGSCKTGDVVNHEISSETENSAPSEATKFPAKTQSTFYELHMGQKPREAEKECASQNIKIVKTKQGDSGNVLVQVFARNDVILQEIERQFPDQKKYSETENLIDADAKPKKCPTNPTGTGRASRSSPLNNSSKKTGNSGNSFLSPSNRESRNGQRSRSSSSSPNRRNPSADKRRMRNRLLSQAEISPSMDTMEENFGFLPNRVTVQITPSMNDQITATLNTVENFYRMIGEETDRDRLLTAQSAGAQIVPGKTVITKEDVAKTAAGSQRSSSFVENHSYMRDQLERIFKESAGSGMRYDGTPVDRVEREQEDRQYTFEGKWVPVYDYKDGDGNVLKLPGMATAEWMTLTDGRGQYSTAGGGRIFARRRRSKNLEKQGSDESGETDSASGEETFLEHVGPETDHLSLTNVRETGKRLIYFLDKTEEASAAATKLVSDVIGSPETEESIDGLDEDDEKTGLTDQIMLIFSSSDLAAGAFGGIGGESVPEVWGDSAATLPSRQSTTTQEADLSGVAIENYGNGNKTPELWTTVESGDKEDRRKEFSDRRWFSDEEHVVHSPPSQEELKRRHRSIEDGISSFDTKLNNLTDRIRRLRKSSLQGSDMTDSYNTAADQYAANFDNVSNTSVRPTTFDSQAACSSYYSAVSSMAVSSDSSAVVGYGSSSDGALPFDPIITAHEYAEMISVFKFCSVQFRKSFDTRRPIRWTDDRPPIMVLPPRWVWGGPFADTRSFPTASLHSSAIVHLSEQREYSPIAVAIVSDNFYVVATSNMLYSQPGTIAVSVSRRRKSRRKRKNGGTEEEAADASFEAEDGKKH